MEWIPIDYRLPMVFIIGGICMAMIVIILLRNKISPPTNPRDLVTVYPLTVAGMKPRGLPPLTKVEEAQLRSQIQDRLMRAAGDTYNRDPRLAAAEVAHDFAKYLQFEVEFKDG